MIKFLKKQMNKPGFFSALRVNVLAIEMPENWVFFEFFLEF